MNEARDGRVDAPARVQARLEVVVVEADAERLEIEQDLREQLADQKAIKYALAVRARVSRLRMAWMSIHP